MGAHEVFRKLTQTTLSPAAYQGLSDIVDVIRSSDSPIAMIEHLLAHAHDEQSRQQLIHRVKGLKK